MAFRGLFTTISRNISRRFGGVLHLMSRKIYTFGSKVYIYTSEVQAMWSETGTAHTWALRVNVSSH